MSFQKNITPFIKHIYSKLLTSFSFLTLGMHVHCLLVNAWVAGYMCTFIVCAWMWRPEDNLQYHTQTYCLLL